MFRWLDLRDRFGRHLGRMRNDLKAGATPEGPQPPKCAHVKPLLPWRRWTTAVLETDCERRLFAHSSLNSGRHHHIFDPATSKSCGEVDGGLYLRGANEPNARFLKPYVDNTSLIT